MSPISVLRRLPAVWYVVAVVLALLLVAVALQTTRLHRAQRQYAEQSLATVNERARHDTTRRVLTDERTRVRVLGDSMAAFQRMAVQRTQQQDALDRALNAQRIALNELRADIRALRASTTSTGPTTETPEGERRAHFDVRQAPYTVAADVVLPRPPAAGRLDVRVQLDTLALGVRLSCRAPDANGIREAVATVTAPEWAAVELRRVEQDAELCRSPALLDPTRRDRRTRLAVVLGYGITTPVPFVAGGGAGVHARAFLGLALARPVPCPRFLSFVPGC